MEHQKPIRLGAMHVTLVDPFRGQERRYNRWYEEDHFWSAVMFSPGLLSGARFVARSQEKAQRRVEAPFVPEDGSLLALYWHHDDGSSYRAWVPGAVEQLKVEGRMYPDRDLVFNLRGVHVASAQRPGMPVPVELALEHRFPHVGLSLIALAGGDDPAEHLRRYDATAVAGADSPVALVASFVLEPPGPDPMGRSKWPAEVGATSPLGLVVWFFDRDPAPAWPALLDAQADRAAAGVGRVLWSGTFVATVPGTDTYMDELWPS